MLAVCFQLSFSVFKMVLIKLDATTILMFIYVAYVASWE